MQWHRGFKLSMFNNAAFKQMRRTILSYDNLRQLIQLFKIRRKGTATEDDNQFSETKCTMSRDKVTLTIKFLSLLLNNVQYETNCFSISCHLIAMNCLLVTMQL